MNVVEGLVVMEGHAAMGVPATLAGAPQGTLAPIASTLQGIFDFTHSTSEISQTKMDGGMRVILTWSS